jgi:hypothetical protein
MPTPITWVPFDEASKPKLRRGPHQMAKLKRLPWPYCKRCGLLALKNDVTRRALRAECVTLEDA